MSDPGDPVVDEHGRPEPHPAGDEPTTLLGFLGFQRATLEWKCRGVDADGMRSRVAASSMTLAGLLKHMAWVEDHWFSHWLHGNERAEPWRSVDWSLDRDWEWTSAVADDPEDVRALWRASVARSETLTARALVDGGLDGTSVRRWDNGEAPSLRWILVHMIEEYARHNGHADLLREAVDGETGE
ncbi:MAG: hypothetical protein RL330_403 [Actinomycetota bacterium]